MGFQDHVTYNGTRYDFRDTGAREQIGDLKSHFDGISENTYNLLDVNVLKRGNVTVSDGVASGTATAFTAAFGSGIPTGITYGENVQYTISGKARNTGETTSGNGLSIRAGYSDGTFSYAIFPNSWTTYNEFTLTTTSGKTVTKIYFDYSSAGSNTWDVSELMIEQGTTKHPYVPTKSATDLVARGEIENIDSQVDYNTAAVKNIYTPIVWEYGTISATGVDGATSENFRTNKIYHIKAGSVLKKTDAFISIMAFYYTANDRSTFDTSEQIMPASTQSYTFPSDCYARLLLQNPSHTVGDIQEANTVVISEIIDADIQNKVIGIDVAIMGYSAYLGNAIAVRFPNGKLFGIDSFIAAAQENFRADYKRFGINHLDYFMLSHYHKDHAGNVEYLIDNGYIDEDTTVFLPQDLITTYDTNIFFDWLDEDGPKAIFEDLYPKIVASGCTIVKPTEGYVFSEAGVDVKFFNCDHSIYYPGGAYASSNYNNLSIGCYVTIGNMNLCDPADMGYEAQQKMVSLGTMVKANLYCSTHHGWDNGNANNYYGLLPAWINRLSPDVVFSMDYSSHNALIMTKGAPMQSWCESSGVPNYRTAKNGTILLHMDAYNWHFKGGYTRYIRNDKNWSYSDNSEHIET